MTQINKIRNEREGITTDTKDMQRILRKYYEQLYAGNWTTWMKWKIPRKIQSTCKNKFKMGQRLKYYT